MSKYDQMTDEQLIAMIRKEEPEVTDYLMVKYKNLVRKEAKAMFLLGGENDDLIQEGMIGLFKAIQSFDLEKGVGFSGFARLCIRRQMYSAIEASKRKKHGPLNSYVSFYEENKGKKNQVMDTILAGDDSNPEEVLLQKEKLEHLEEKLEESLSELERRVLYLHLHGTDYKMIAELLDKNPKTIDNALQRIKNKFAKIIEK